MRLWWSVPLLVVTTGCASSEFSSNDRAGSGAGEDAASGGSDGGGLDSGVAADGDDYAWWRLDADLALMDDMVVVEDTSLRLTVLDEAGLELCSMAGVVGTATSSLVLPDELLLTWWVFDEISWDGDCIPGPAIDRLPSTMSVGVGSMHPEIEAVLDGMPELESGSGAGLNGAYAQLSGVDTVYVFGAVGPAAAWSDGAEPAAGVPLEDGVWLVRAAYGFRL